MYHYEKPDNLVDLFETGVAKYPRNDLFGTKNVQGTYEWVTYEEVGRRVDNLRGGLAQLGVGKDDAVGIIANNRTEWAIAAFATYGLGARFIPMYEAELESTWRYIIEDSFIKVLLVSKPEIYERVRDFPRDIKNLDKVFLIEGDGENSMAALEKLGEDHPVDSVHPDPNDIAVLIYTSGTTGNPKGVLLSHGNFTSNAMAGYHLYQDDLDEDGRSLSILPWAHAYGQTAELYNYTQFGGSIAFIESIPTLADDMKVARPTFIMAVPRVFNKIYDAIWTKMDEEGGLVKKLFVMSVEAARDKRELADKGRTSLITNIKCKIADKLVFQKIRDQFGGRLHGATTGSATMNKDIANFFWDIGVPVFDCYGLTETSPAVTMSYFSAHKVGSVGKTLENIKVVIDKSVVEEGSDDGEIIVYGPNVMHGYHNQPEATEKVMTDDGGFRTGDRGRLDEDGYLYITGRIKEQYKLANGKYVFPSTLEEDIKLIRYVENAMVYGDGRDYNICLVVPDFLVLDKYAQEHNLPTEREELVKREEIRELIFGEIVTTLKGKYGGYEIPKKLLFLTEDFTVENGMLTQTMKPKRHVVLEKYKDKIEELYT